MKFFIPFISAALILGACSSGEETTTTDQTSAAISWNVLSTEEQAILCDLYFTVEKKEITSLLMSEPDPVSEGQAEAFYNVLNEECG